MAAGSVNSPDPMQQQYQQAAQMRLNQVPQQPQQQAAPQNIHPDQPTLPTSPQPVTKPGLVAPPPPPVDQGGNRINPGTFGETAPRAPVIAPQAPAPPPQAYQDETIQNWVAGTQSQNANYDQQYQALVNASLRQAADLQAQHDVAYGQANSAYDLSNYLINRKLDQDQLQNTGQYAGSGTLHSSIYGDAANLISQGAQNKLSEAALRRTQAQQNIDQALRSGTVNLLNALEGGQADAAARAAQQAYQRQMDEQQAQFQRDQLEMERQGNASQAAYMQQMAAAQQGTANAQAQALQRLMAQMQPITYPNGSVAGPSAAQIQAQIRQGAASVSPAGTSGPYQARLTGNLSW